MTSSDGRGFLVILNKRSELRFEFRRTELIFRAWAKPVQFVDCRVRACIGWVSELRADDRRTVSIEKLCVSLSLSLSLSSCRKPKLKDGNKSFVPETRESSVFPVFSDSYAYEQSMNVCFTYSHSEYVTSILANLRNGLIWMFSIFPTKKDIETRLTKAWTAINRLSIIWKSDLTDKMKRSFFQAVVTSILLYGCTTWTLTKRLEKKLDGNYTRMLGAILNKSWRQHPTRHQLYGHLPPITKTIQVRRTRHPGHCWRSRDEHIRDVLLWTPTHGRAKAG